MNQIKMLAKGGYTVDIVFRDGIQMVDIKRTQKATMAPAVAGELQKFVMRNIDEAAQYIAASLMVRLAEIDAGTKPLADDEKEEVLIAKLNMALGREKGSDGTKWMDYLAAEAPAKKMSTTRTPVMA